MRTWKTVNEKRAEKGLEPIDLSKVENPADLPMNVQLVQLYQSQNAQDGMDGADMGGFGEDEAAGFDETEEVEEQIPAENEAEDGMNKAINKSLLII